jgi:hypothetical protein
MINKIETLEEASRYFTADIPDDLKKLLENAIERELEKKQYLKKQLLKEAERKKSRFFHQVDGFVANMLADSLIHPDEDGDLIVTGNTWELINSDNEVRVLFHQDGKPEDVIRLLEKILKFLKNHPVIKASRNMEILHSTHKCNR